MIGHAIDELQAQDNLQMNVARFSASPGST
jgi:hypothetical protein